MEQTHDVIRTFFECVRVLVAPRSGAQQRGSAPGFKLDPTHMLLRCCERWRCADTSCIYLPVSLYRRCVVELVVTGQSTRVTKTLWWKKACRCRNTAGTSTGR